MKIRKNGRRLVLSVVATVLCLGLVTSVTISVLASTETEYDLTTDPSGLGTVTINGAIWEIFQPTDPTGSGVFQSFFREQASGTERGYNTDGRPLQFDELKSKTFTRSVLLADVPQVKVGDVIYREFQLDINENKSDPDWYISLDEFQVWVTNNAELLGYDESARSFAAGTAELVYDLDVGIDGESMIKMDFRANPGSGKRDYRVFVPESNFEGKIGMYCVIFARHGDAYTTDDGYEEWGVAVYPATKAGYKFHDLNYNGIWDDGEPGLKGWTINLSGTSADGKAVSMSTTTDDDGHYSFSVPAGQYLVTEIIPDGWFQSKPGTPSAPEGYDITLGNGALDLDNDFGNFQEAKKSGYKFHDQNYNGIWDDGEPALKGWTINLVGKDGMEKDVNLSTTTDDDGSYSFTVDPGTYTVSEVLMDETWFQSYPADPGTYEVTLKSSDDEKGNNFGNYQKAKKSGYKFHDQNYNGIWDDGEPGLKGWTINLKGTDGMGSDVDLSTTTNDGSYSFTVDPGTYTVSEVLKDETWFRSYPADPGTYEVTLKSGDDEKGNNFGNYQQAKKSGYKFHDLNYNGVWDDGEPGLKGWTINLKGTDGMGKDVNLSTTTNDDGSYSFTVDPGTYTVSEVLMDETWFRSYPADPGTYEVTLKSSDDEKGNNFGNYQQAKKSGYKFNDLNADGIWDDGEPGLKGWTINLKGTDGMGSDVDLSTTTDDGGYYEFANLKPGTYTVSEVLKDETWFQSYPADPGTYEVTLKSGDDDKGNNFGNYQQADLSIDKTGKITYTIKVYNDGPSPALNVVVEDKLPGNLTWEISSSSGFTTITIDSGTLKGTIDSLAAGASAWVTVEADIDGDWENSPLPNTATTKSITPDPNESNNEDDADIPPVS